jgi:DNA primase
LNQQSAEVFLRALGSKKVDFSSLPWVHGNCPLARWKHQKGTDTKPSFGVLTGPVKTRCHCFSCNTSGSPTEIIKEILLRANGEHGYDLRTAERVLEDDEGLLDLSVDEEARYEQPVIPFPESFWHSFVPVTGIDEPQSYLHSRGISLAEMKKHDIRWDGLQRRVCFPVRGFDGLLYGVRGRAIDSTNQPRYMSYPCSHVTNPQVWLGESTVDFDDPILVAEASFQRLACMRLYPNVVAPLSASIHAAQAKRMSKGFCFVHLFDGDKAGREASKKLRAFLPKAKHVVLYLPDDCGPDDISMNELHDILARALPL